MNPNVSWIENGKKWSCNLCGMKNTVEDWYFSAVNVAGLRFDRLLRPELQLGSYEFAVNTCDYSLKEPQKPTFVFAIDISSRAVHTGVTLAGLRAVRSSIQKLKRLQSILHNKQNNNKQSNSNNNKRNNNSKQSSNNNLLEMNENFKEKNFWQQKKSFWWFIRQYIRSKNNNNKINSIFNTRTTATTS